MPRKPNKKPSFFRVLIDMGFTQILRLPSAFLRKNAPENVKIRVHSGRKWNVKIEKIENDGGVFCFTKGWPEFAEDASLQIGEFLVFTLISTSEFAVNIYDTSFCEREIPPTHDSPVMLNSQAIFKMARPEDQTASFMMFGLGEFSSQLCIPTMFVAKYRQVTNQVSMDLETDAGKRWEVKIKKDKNEDYYMKEGWQEFMKENEIDDADFLTFRLVGDSTFNVKIYRSDGCLKDPTSPTSSEIGGEDESEIESERGRGGPPKKKRGSDNNPLYFEKRLKSYQKSRVSLPQEFSRAADMKDKAYVRMEFVATHHCERVVVDARPSRFDLAKGWFDFRVANNLEYEKNYSFEFKPNENAIHVKKVQNYE